MERTPHIGIGSPPDPPLLVRVISNISKPVASSKKAQEIASL